MACLELRNRGEITEERKGAVVETTEGVATILKSMTIPNPSLTRVMDSQEGDIMEVLTTKEILHTTLTKGMLLITLQTTTNSSILFSKAIRLLGATVDREGTQVGVATSEAEEDKEDQVGSTRQQFWQQWRHVQDLL